MSVNLNQFPYQFYNFKIFIFRYPLDLSLYSAVDALLRPYDPIWATVAAGESRHRPLGYRAEVWRCRVSHYAKG